MTDREHFERIARAYGLGLRMVGDRYTDHSTQAAWEAAQAFGCGAGVPEGWEIRRDRLVSGIIHLRTPDGRICISAAGDSKRAGILYELADALLAAPAPEADQPTHGEPVAWAHDTPYGRTYSFADELGDAFPGLLNRPAPESPEADAGSGAGGVDVEALTALIADELARIDGYDPEDQRGGLYDLRWTGGTEPEPAGDAWTMDYLPKAERIARRLASAQQADIYEAYKTWPDDIRAKLSVHDLRRMSGWAPRTHVGDWRIDTSAGRPILVYQNCSVIEAEAATYVLGLIRRDAQQPSAPAAGEGVGE